jgi:energy-coupling factor transporter ATP-binding protein EcfA2
MSYDFRTLSPLDFEELVRDLLQAEWGMPLESFGPGRDQGIDIRRLHGPHKLVIQAKHYVASGYPGLLRSAKEEREKALKLAASRYLLATSVSLTPARKDKLVAAMGGVPLTPSDILGQEDLNNLLGRHPVIERRYFKLWLASTPVLERILHSGVYNRTAAELDIIRDMIPRFVQNRSVADAEEKLAETGTLIVAGQPGVGKTTLARMLVWLHAEQEWNIFVVDSLDEAFKVAETGERRLILLDDFLGQVRLSPDHVRGIDARLPPLISRIAAHDNLRFILTTRDYILAQARDLSARLAPGQINAREYVLNVGSYTRTVRARILYNHIFFSSLDPEQRASLLDDDFYLEIIDHKNFNPRIVEEVTNINYLALTDRTIRETIAAVLANPELLWERPYRQHIDADGRAMMIALFLSGRHALIDGLKTAFVRVARALGSELPAAEIEPRFRTAFRSLEGSVLALLGTLVMFANPGVADFLQATIAKDRLIPYLLPVAEGQREIETLWSIFIENGADDDRVEAWTEALDRMESKGQGTLFDYIELAADFCGQLDHPPLEERLASALDSFDRCQFDPDDVGSACAMLEKSHDTILPGELGRRFRQIATRQGLSLLTDFAPVLSFEDIESLDDALHGYGTDPAGATKASRIALKSIETDIDFDICEIESVEELDEHEQNLLKLMEKRRFSPLTVTRAIERRRDVLLEEGRLEPRNSYQRTGVETSEPTISDQALRSMFSGLAPGK